jgi:hypothetical protein
VRVNLEHVPELLRPAQEALDPEMPSPWSGVKPARKSRQAPREE